MDDESVDTQLETALSQISNTFKFHGVEIKSVDFDSDPPKFKVKISKHKRYKSLEDTLTFVYWTLWVLTYGKYSDDKSDLTIELNYKEVK